MPVTVWVPGLVSVQVACVHDPLASSRAKTVTAVTSPRSFPNASMKWAVYDW